MKKFTTRIAITASSVAAAGLAVLSAGGTASAVAPALPQAHHPAVSVKAADQHWDHGVGYLLEQGYSCDEVRGWHPDDRGTHSIRHDCDGLFYRGGHFYRWEGEGRGWSGR